MVPKSSPKTGVGIVSACIQLISRRPFPRIIYYARRLNFIGHGLFAGLYVRLIFLLRGYGRIPRTDLWLEGIAMLPSVAQRVSFQNQLLGSPRGGSQQVLSTLSAYEDHLEASRSNFDFSHDSIADNLSIAEIVCSEQLHQAIRDQLRLPFFFTYIGGWVTYGPTADLRANAMAWHIDFDRLLEVKVFVFLDDTAPGSGFQYCLGSHRLRLDIADGGVIDLPESYASAEPSQPLYPITLDGQAGDVIISLNWGVHRDAPPSVSGRAKVVLELQIGVEPFGISHQPRESNHVKIPADSAALAIYRTAKSANPFMFHLFRFE
jgi:hypothetical protein